MAVDSANLQSQFYFSQIDHLYGDKVHLIFSPLAHTLLARLGHSSSSQPEINYYVTKLYEILYDVVSSSLFPKVRTQVETRMNSPLQPAIYEGFVFDSKTSVVSIALTRAGTVPSQTIYNHLNYILDPSLIRQDFIYISRQTNTKGEVSGASIFGAKIGGDVQNKILLIPDPMGATGETMSEVYRYYMEKVKGPPFIVAALHLVVTPEYLKKMTQNCPNMHIFALRLDRGLSSPSVLEEIPGKNWPEERGLNEHQYIIPGLGGLGEMLNNSYC
jgi:uracil phosphoribosyltransferase